MIISNSAILNDLAELLTYEADIALPVWNSLDVTINGIGLKLLNFCKSSGLQILNF